MVFIKNRKAKHDYFVIEEFEAGLVLLGSEVKSIREGRVDLKGSWGYIRNGEVFINCSISKWGSSPFNHEETRPRKLLLRKREIEKISKEISLKQGLTLVPLSFYLKNGKIKCNLGLCSGKHKYDKRNDLKERSIKRDLERGRW